jgi:hypothetical protein
VAVVGAESLTVDYAQRVLRAADGRVVREGNVFVNTCASSFTRPCQGEWISLDGTRGVVVVGKIEMHLSDVMRVVRGYVRGEWRRSFHACLVTREMSADSSKDYKLFHDVLSWCDAVRRLKVRAGVLKTQDQLDHFRFTQMLTHRNKHAMRCCWARKASACVVPSTCFFKAHALTQFVI